MQGMTSANTGHPAVLDTKLVIVRYFELVNVRYHVVMLGQRIAPLVRVSA